VEGDRMEEWEKVGLGRLSKGCEERVGYGRKKSRRGSAASCFQGDMGF